MIIINLSCHEIIEIYADMVYRIALSQVKNPQDADDVFQDVFVQLIRNLCSIKNEQHLKYWLIRTTLNRCKNYFNTFWVRGVELSEKSLDVIGQDNIDIDETREVIQSLPSKFRDVVLLFYYEDYPVGEIATILKIKQGTVKSRLHKARIILKNKLKED